MTKSDLSSLRLFVAGWAFFFSFVLLFYFVAPHNEASLLTRTIVFVGLIPPPVCFAAGIGLGFMRKVPASRRAAWANAAAIFAHGILAIAILQTSLA